jgi:glycosyl transferase, family 25
MSSFPRFVINLAHDIERRTHMQAVLAELGMTAEFVPGVYGKDLTPTVREAVYDRAKSMRIYGVEMMNTEIGCYLSHYRLYERMAREQIPVALIMEDDLAATPNFPAVASELANDPALVWEVVRFESQRGRVLEPKRRSDEGVRVRDVGAGGLYRLRTHVLGLGAYLIRLEGAMKMLSYGRRIFMPIDQTMDRFWENGITPYVVRPFPVRQRDDMEDRTGDRSKARRQAYGWDVKTMRRLTRLSDSFAKRLYLLTHP